MTRSDDIILGALSKLGWSLPPKALAVNLENVSQSTVQRRLGKLEDARLVEQHGPRGYRRITDLGRRYLVGDVSQEEIVTIEAAMEEPDS